MLKASESKPEDNAPPQYYQPQEIPGLTRFLVKCHPQAKKICEELDKFFDQYCLWRNERERELFLMIEPHMWGCMAFPLASNDRVLHIVKASSLLFLIDGTNIPQCKHTIRKRLIPMRDRSPRGHECGRRQNLCCKTNTTNKGQETSR